jgi:methionyl-tRNA formyltransferase
VNVVFLGSGAFGLPTLQALSREHTVVGVVTQPDKPAGRSMQPTPTPIGAWAAEHLPQVPLFKPDRINTLDVVAQIRALPASAWVVIAYGQKLGQPLLHDIFAINLHASLLPRWRGAAPINHAILAGDADTGNSVITLAERMDAGFVLAQSPAARSSPSSPPANSTTLLSNDGPALVLETLAAHAAERLVPQTQDESRVTLASKLSRADAWLDFSQPADHLRRRIHGLTPWPGVSVKLGEIPLKLLRAQSVAAPAEQPAGAAGGSFGDVNPSRRPFSFGQLIDPARGLVSCGQSTTLQLLEVQPAGKKPMTWPDFARGRRPNPGDTLIPEVAPAPHTSAPVNLP